MESSFARMVSRRNVRMGAALFLASTSTVYVVSTTSAAGAATTTRHVVLCGSVLTKPTTVPVLCGSDLGIVQSIKWKSWATTAVGSGSFVSSAAAPQAVTVTLDQSIRCANGQSYFGRLSVTAKKPLPKGVSSRVQLKTCDAATQAGQAGNNPDNASGTVPPTVKSAPPVSLPEGNSRIAFSGMDNVPLGTAITSLGDRVNFTKNVGTCLVVFIGDNVQAISTGTAATGKVDELSTLSPELSTAEGVKVGLTTAQVTSAYGARAQAWSKGLQVKSVDGATTLYVSIQNDKVAALTLRPTGQQPITCG
jgi:hypothetical protein